MANFESEGNVVPMLCPGCATLDDIPDWPRDPAEKLTKVIAGCHRCGFTFPILPGPYRGLTLHAILNHRCKGPDDGNWAAAGKAITERYDILIHDTQAWGRFIDAAFAEPHPDDWGYEDNQHERQRHGITPSDEPTGEMTL